MAVSWRHDVPAALESTNSTRVLRLLALMAHKVNGVSVRTKAFMYGIRELNVTHNRKMYVRQTSENSPSDYRSTSTPCLCSNNKSSKGDDVKSTAYRCDCAFVWVREDHSSLLMFAWRRQITILHYTALYCRTMVAPSIFSLQICPMVSPPSKQWRCKVRIGTFGPHSMSRSMSVQKSTFSLSFLFICFSWSRTHSANVP